MNPPRLARAWAPALLLVVGCVIAALLPQVLGMVGPGGSDPGLWILAAENLRVGASPTTAPLYPGFAAGLAAISGLPSARACHALTLASFALLPPVTWLLARRLGAGVHSGLAAGFLGVALPSSLVFALQIQADALTALVLLGAGMACVAFLLRPGWLQLLALAGAAAGLSLTREHIVPMAALMVLLALVPRGSLWVRAVRALAVLAAVWIAPMLLGLGPGLPWQQTWFVDRVGEAARDATGGEIPKHIRELPAHMRRPYEEAIRQGDQLGITLLHMRRSLVMSWHAWLAVGLGVVGTALLTGRRRLALGIMLLGLFPPLLAWSQPRHIAIFGPLAAAAWAAAYSRSRPWTKLSLLVAAVAVACLVQGEWAQVARKQLAQARTRAELAAFGDELCSHLEPGAVVMAGNARSAAYCPLPRVVGGMGTPYDWKLLWLGDMPRQHEAWASLEASGWAQLNLESQVMPVYRLMPWLEGDERPCAGSVPVGPRSYSRFSSMHELPLSPPCDQPSPVTVRGGMRPGPGPRH